METIIHHHLKMSKVPARWVPRKLTDHDRARRVSTSQEIVDAFESNTVKFVQQIVTGDETRVHHWEPESKVKSVQWRDWRHTSSPPPRKFRTLPSAGKLMVTILWDSNGLLLIDYLPPKTTMNGQYYASLLLKLHDAINEKRPGMLTQGVTTVAWQRSNSQVHDCTGGCSWLWLHWFWDIARYWSKTVDFNLPISILFQSEFHGDRWHKKTRVPRLSYSVVCVLLHLATLVQYRLVTDEQRERQTERHNDSIHRASMSSCGNESRNKTDCAVDVLWTQVDRLLLTPQSQTLQRYQPDSNNSLQHTYTLIPVYFMESNL